MSDAVTVVTAVVFSLTLTTAVLPPPLLLMTGAASRVRARLSIEPEVMPTLLPCTTLVATAMAVLVPVVRYTVRPTTSVGATLR
jgi:hypothetical protein